MVGVLPLRFISVLFFVIFNLAVPSNQAKLANEGSDGDFQESNLPHPFGDFQESNLPHLFESMLTKLSTEMMKNIENICAWAPSFSDKSPYCGWVGVDMFEGMRVCLLWRRGGGG